jgi:hypothetical protein
VFQCGAPRIRAFDMSHDFLLQCWETNKIRYEEGENEKLIEPLKRGEKVVNYARICEEIVDKNEKK